MMTESTNKYTKLLFIKITDFEFNNKLSAKVKISSNHQKTKKIILTKFNAYVNQM